MRPCLLTGLEETFLPFLSSLSSVDRVQDIVGLLLLLQELNSFGLERGRAVTVGSVLRVILACKVAVLLLELLLGFADVSLESLSPCRDKFACGRVGLFFELLCVSGGKVQEVGIDGGQMDQGCQGVRCGFACRSGTLAAWNREHIEVGSLTLYRSRSKRRRRKLADSVRRVGTSCLIQKLGDRLRRKGQSLMVEMACCRFVPSYPGETCTD